MHTIYVLIALAHMCAVIPPVIAQTIPKATNMTCENGNLYSICNAFIGRAWDSNAIRTLTGTDQSYHVGKCQLTFKVVTPNPEFKFSMSKEQWLNVSQQLNEECRRKGETAEPDYGALNNIRNYYTGKLLGQTINIQLDPFITYLLAPATISPIG